jgi:4,5-dihydroxyphthalate decarboxylase
VEGRNQVRAMFRPYDSLSLLFRKGLSTASCDVTFDSDGELADAFGQTPPPITEMSLCRYAINRSIGDDRYLGVPFFVQRSFRHRSFFVPISSPFDDLSQLRGARIGTDAWVQTGSTWSRAALRERGVNTSDVEWVVGPTDARSQPLQAESLPANVSAIGPRDTLLSLLLSGDLDAMTITFFPPEAGRPGDIIRRLYVDYQLAESEYYSRTHLYPSHHIVAVRRDVADAYTDLPRQLYDGFLASWSAWMESLLLFGDSTPWSVPDHEKVLEEFAEVFPYREVPSEHDRRMIDTFCKELEAQALTTTLMDYKKLFGEFGED